jgi:hypothetical protein
MIFFSTKCKWKCSSIVLQISIVSLQGRYFIPDYAIDKEDISYVISTEGRNL